MMSHSVKKYVLAAAAALMMLPAAADKPKNVLDVKYSIEDSSIVFPESFDTDTQQLLEGWYLKNYTSSAESKTSKSDPGATAAQIKQRLADLPTVIEMPYNQIVHSYIERYTKKGRSQVTAMLGLSSYYMPIFEQALEQYGLPLELKYLPVIESALNPNAVSPSGAAGLWQFILSTARGHDMEVTSLVDERRDPYVSSQKACQYLKKLHDMYDDWGLAIAAYNCGPGTVNKALTRAGGDRRSHDYWSIYYYLPAETRGYVPAFIAANYVMTYYPEHDIAPVLITKPLITDTIHVYNRVHFNQISAILEIPVDEIRILNPQFRSDIIPGSASHPYNLILPSQQIHAYLVSEDQILNYQRDTYARRLEATPGGDPNAAVEVAMEETVMENPSDIAYAEREAAEEEFRELNGTTPQESAPASTPKRSRRGPATAESSASSPQVTTAKAETPKPAAATKKETTPAKKETTPAKKETTTAKKEAPAKKETASQSGKKNAKTDKNSGKKQQKATPKTHTVSEGENLSVIAKRNGVTVEELRKSNPKLKGDMIRPGDKLTVPTAKSGKAAGNATQKNQKNSKQQTTKSGTNSKKKKR